jgi:hypothetical protein
VAKTVPAGLLALSSLELGQAVFDFLNFQRSTTNFQNCPRRRHPWPVSRSTLRCNLLERPGSRRCGLTNGQSSTLNSLTCPSENCGPDVSTVV